MTSARYFDWIWHVRGSLALAPGQSSEEAFDRLTPLFRESGTSHERAADMLTFRKKDAAAQDKMSIFDGGMLQIQRGVAGAMLHYRLTSRALLFCFLAPLLFLSFAGAIIVIGKVETPSAETTKKADKKDLVLPQNPIDKALGAPAPDKPKKDGKDKEKGKDKKMSPTAAYVFAALFAILYLVGRILEDRLVRALFKRRLSGVSGLSPARP